MNVQATPPAPPPAGTAPESWVPMIAIALGQAIMSFNVAALPVSLSGMVASFGVPPTTIATGIVMYSLAVAGFVMLGAKLVQRFGATTVFRYVVLAFGAAQVLMTFAPAAPVMLAAQLLAGLAAAVNVPALVALIAHHYRGAQQATAVGALGSARAGAGVAAFLIGGMLGTFIGWRPVFGLLILVCALVFVLSSRLKPQAGRPEVRIDLVGVVLAAAAIILTVFGVNNLNRWGLGTARPGAPFDVLGMSPAPLMIVTGLALLQLFVAWCRRVQARGGTPLLDLRVITSNQERAAVIAMFSVVALEAMLNFAVPLYIQIVQGRTPIETAIAMMPFNLTVFFTAMLVVRLYRRFTPRVIGMVGFALCTLALLWLAFVIRNDWGAPVVMTGLILFGIGQGLWSRWCSTCWSAPRRRSWPAMSARCAARRRTWPPASAPRWRARCWSACSAPMCCAPSPRIRACRRRSSPSSISTASTSSPTIGCATSWPARRPRPSRWRRRSRSIPRPGCGR
ncbi:MFS transporter [Paeniroseomonas aquatica]|uniref:MFS transporter n=1 Tax=Paeniroseomonas aquatica TaxID=373043 RepID=UPI003623FCF8